MSQQTEQAFRAGWDAYAGQLTESGPSAEVDECWKAYQQKAASSGVSATTLDVFNDHSMALELLREAVRNATPCACGICWHCRVRTWLFTEAKSSASPSRLSEAVTQIEALIAEWREEAKQEARDRDPGWPGAEAKLQSCADELEDVLTLLKGQP